MVVLYHLQSQLLLLDLELLEELEQVGRARTGGEACTMDRRSMEETTRSTCPGGVVGACRGGAVYTQNIIQSHREVEFEEFVAMFFCLARYYAARGSSLQRFVTSGS